VDHLEERFPYFDLAIGSPANRNNLKSEIGFNWKELEGAVDAYDSLYRFPVEFKEHFEANKTVAGYAGEVWSKALVFDIDNENLEKALKDTRKLLHRLYWDFGISRCDIDVYFSGAKGFHVYLPASLFGGFEPSPRLPRLHAQLARYLADPLRIDASIYERNRIFRRVNTINSKTGLYKIYLTSNELSDLSLPVILELAKRARWFPEPGRSPGAVPKLHALKAEMLAESPRQSLPVINTPATSSKLCIDSMLKGVSKGERHNSAFRLADYWKKQGCVPDIAVANLVSWNKLNEEKDDQEDHFRKIVKDVYSRAYDYGCHDPLLDAKCDVACYLYPAKSGQVSRQNGVIARHFMKPIKLSDIVSTPIEWLWHPFIPSGKVSLIEGDPDIGKSWTLLKIVTALTRGDKLPRSRQLEPGTALLMMGEDALADTVKPRLEVMGCDIGRVFALDGALSLNSDGLQTIEAAIAETKAKVVVIDPLVAYMGSDVDMNRANHMRAMMGALGKVAERTRSAIICLRHLTKGSESSRDSGNKGNPLYRGIGSIDLSASVRSVIRVEKFPDSEIRFLYQIKNNVGPKGDPVYYELTRDRGLVWKAI
jgi:hypothetical protein